MEATQKKVENIISLFALPFGLSGVEIEKQIDYFSRPLLGGKKQKQKPCEQNSS